MPYLLKFYLYRHESVTSPVNYFVGIFTHHIKLVHLIFTYIYILLKILRGIFDHKTKDMIV